MIYLNYYQAARLADTYGPQLYGPYVYDHAAQARRNGYVPYMDLRGKLNTDDLMFCLVLQRKKDDNYLYQMWAKPKVQES